MAIHQCEMCMEEFESKRFTLYCSTECRQQAHYERRQKGLTRETREFAIRNCKGCGSEFRPASTNQKYCTKTCYSENRIKSFACKDPRHATTAQFSFVSKTKEEYQSETLTSTITGPTDFQAEIDAYLKSGGGVKVLKVAASQGRGVVRTNLVNDGGTSILEGLWL